MSDHSRIYDLHSRTNEADIPFQVHPINRFWLSIGRTCTRHPLFDRENVRVTCNLKYPFDAINTQRTMLQDIDIQYNIINCTLSYLHGSFLVSITILVLSCVSIEILVRSWGSITIFVLSWVVIVTLKLSLTK